MVLIWCGHQRLFGRHGALAEEPQTSSLTCYLRTYNLTHRGAQFQHGDKRTPVYNRDVNLRREEANQHAKV